MERLRQLIHEIHRRSLLQVLTEASFSTGSETAELVEARQLLEALD